MFPLKGLFDVSTKRSENYVAFTRFAMVAKRPGKPTLSHAII